jgi:hypothetical protein
MFVVFIYWYIKMTEHNSGLPRSIDEINMSLYTIGDSWRDDMIKDGITAIIRASQETGIDIWAYLKTYTPDENKGFMFSNDATIGMIGRYMEVGHSGSSYAWTMRQLQRIVHMPPIPQRRWLNSHLLDVMNCGICQENINDIIQTPCNHHFCYTCIQEWIKIKSSCPNCRANI